LADCGDGCAYDRTDMPRDAWLRTCMPAH
jgi:hypothetical protein